MADNNGIYALTQFLYDNAEIVLHKYLGLPHNLPVEVMAEGFFGGYLLTWLLQAGSNHVVDKITPGFDYNDFPLLEKIAVVGLPLVTFIFGVVSPEYFTQITNSQPMGNLGIAMAYLGGTFAVGQDLKKRRLETHKEEIKSLENKLKRS